MPPVLFYSFFLHPVLFPIPSRPSPQVSSARPPPPSRLCQHLILLSPVACGPNRCRVSKPPREYETFALGTLQAAAMYDSRAMPPKTSKRKSKFYVEFNSRPLYPASCIPFSLFLSFSPNGLPKAKTAIPVFITTRSLAPLPLVQQGP